mmetsp:Transcript_1312/g.3762  ORF Transcript_1312/g.3762 Transcript_1312/m.3762 type:complete len:440 (+) Transcript_1312:60-1379(+)
MPPRLATKTGGMSSKQEGRGKRSGVPHSRALKKKPEARGGRKALRRKTGRGGRRGSKRRGRSVPAVPDNGEASQGNVCPICQETYCPVKFPVVHAPCGHVACVSCSLTWQKKKSTRTCALCRTPVLSIAQCAQLEQLLVRRPEAGDAEAGAQDMSGASASSSGDPEATRAEVKKELQDLSQGDLNFIPGDYRAHIVRVAAHRAVRKGDLTMLENCLRNFKARPSTKLACEVAGTWKKEPRPVLSLLLAHGARLNGHPENRPLHVAVYAGNTRMAEALVEMKADPTRLAAGETALHVAVRRGRLDCVKLLLGHGAKSDVPDPAGRTPDFLAEMAFRMHEVSCPRSPCHRCNERWGIRCALSLNNGGAAPAPRLPQPRPPEAEEEHETESEESSSDWEESDDDVSDMDDWASEDDDEDDDEDDEDEEEEEEDASSMWHRYS